MGKLYNSKKTTGRKMNIAILLAGGTGSRVGKRIAKQHIIVDEHQILEYTLMAFSSSDLIDEILVVTNPLYYEEVLKIKQSYKKFKHVTFGGETRILSAYNGISFLKDIVADEDNIIVSDAARPCITKRELRDIIDSLGTHFAVTSGISSNETLLKVKNDEIMQIIPRDGILRQTSPEGYKFSVLKWLYIQADLSLVKTYKNIGIDQLYACGTKIGIVKSNPLNFKITTPEDLMLFKNVLKQGFDRIINA